MYFYPHNEATGAGLRISLPGNEADFFRLSEALDLCLGPQALVFDLDGVLANVEDSYRLSTLETARAFGLDLAREDLERAVIAGNANNDWHLTKRLLAENGIDVPFNDIYERYQEFYLGTGKTPGLRENETLLVERAVLETIGMRLPLAIVTGRPRAEADWFLNHAGIADLFDVVVCLEDGPNKPNPTPVRLALERLGVERAWMIGDTPDDVRAASAAGALPLGIVAPNGNVRDHSDALRDAGAATVLEYVESVLQLLP